MCLDFSTDNNSVETFQHRQNIVFEDGVLIFSIKGWCLYSCVILSLLLFYCIHFRRLHEHLSSNSGEETQRERKREQRKDKTEREGGADEEN